jgi:hypothetical protein
MEYPQGKASKIDGLYPTRHHVYDATVQRLHNYGYIPGLKEWRELVKQLKRNKSSQIFWGCPLFVVLVKASLIHTCLGALNVGEGRPRGK